MIWQFRGGCGSDRDVPLLDFRLALGLLCRCINWRICQCRYDCSRSLLNNRLDDRDLVDGGDDSGAVGLGHHPVAGQTFIRKARVVALGGRTTDGCADARADVNPGTTAEYADDPSDNPADNPANRCAIAAAIA